MLGILCDCRQVHVRVVRDMNEFTLTLTAVDLLSIGQKAGQGLMVLGITIYPVRKICITYERYMSAEYMVDDEDFFPLDTKLVLVGSLYNGRFAGEDEYSTHVTF